MTELARRDFLKMCLAAVTTGSSSRGVAGAAASDVPVDLAQARFRDLWLHHPCIGDASFDAFVRLPKNPICRGTPPYDWPVNGFLFQDPISNWWYAYVGMYPRGYWPPGGCRLFRSKDKGASWEDLGLVLSGSPRTFDGDGKKPGGTPDVSVCFADGAYHLIYDWAKPDNSDGGLAYARAERPEGPFIRAPGPVHSESGQLPVLGKYKRVYAGTLIKRKHDWVILADMSTPGNAGGTWALVALTAANPSGPYSRPELLLYPESRIFHPAPVEFYPCFTRGDHVYAPATSVGANRSFQTIFRAPVEKAHDPSAWEVERFGSCWHDEPVECETRGLWGQTFSGFADSDGSLTALFPSKDAQDRGTINLAERDWNKPCRDGFTLSAPNGPAVTMLLREHRDFYLKAGIRSSGGMRIFWNHKAPLGSDRIWHAGGSPHPLMFSDCTELAMFEGGWEIRERGPEGSLTILGRGLLPRGRRLARETVLIEQRAGRRTVNIAGRDVFSGASPDRTGSLGFVAEPPSILHVDSFRLSSLGGDCGKFLLATDAILGAGSGRDGWDEEKCGLYRYGTGYASSTAGISCKWNYRGRGFRLWSPRGPAFGRARVSVDGVEAADVSLGSRREEASRPILEMADLPQRFHAVILTQVSGRMPCDCLEIDF